MWPTFFKAALDYLPIQASASSFWVGVFIQCWDWHKEMQPDQSRFLMESLQMLKFTLKKAHLNFTQAAGSCWNDYAGAKKPRMTFSLHCLGTMLRMQWDKIIQELAKDDSESKEAPTIWTLLITLCCLSYYNVDLLVLTLVIYMYFDYDLLWLICCSWNSISQLHVLYCPQYYY